MTCPDRCPYSGPPIQSDMVPAMTRRERYRRRFDQAPVALRRAARGEVAGAPAGERPAHRRGRLHRLGAARTARRPRPSRGGGGRRLHGRPRAGGPRGGVPQGRYRRRRPRRHPRTAGRIATAPSATHDTRIVTNYNNHVLWSFGYLYFCSRPRPGHPKSARGPAQLYLFSSATRSNGFRRCSHDTERGRYIEKPTFA